MIYIIGSLNVDISIKINDFPNPGETIDGYDLKTSIGGKGNNQALAIKKYGADLRMLGAVGSDEYGSLLLKNLKEHDIDTSNIKIRNDYKSGIALIALTDDDNKIIINHGANYSIKIDEVIDFLSDAKKDDYLLLGLEVNYDAVKYAAMLAKNIGMKVILNPAPAKNISDIIEYVDYLIPNENELKFITNENNINKAIKKLENTNLIITLGDKGVFYPREHTYFPAVDTNKAIDTTGAGDTFIGSFLAKLSDNNDVFEAINFARISSSLMCQKRGIYEALANEDEIYNRKNERTKIILDCDPGHDDAIGIMLLGACDKFDVLGVTTVRGNQTIEKTTYNALATIDYLNLEYKVYEGSNKPIKRESPVCEEIHGKTGLDGFPFRKIEKEKEDIDAVSFIIDMCHKTKDITFITTGPMTNVAKAIIKDPSIKSSISKIILMGGSSKKGNITEYAEFNILTDPEAADIIFKSKIDIYMVGLDVTRKCLVDNNVVSRMKKINTRGSDLFVSLMEVFIKNQKDFFGLEGGPLHDPLTIASLIDDKILKFKKAYTSIDTSDEKTAGKTTCDFNSDNHNSYVAIEVDVARYFDLIEESLKFYK